MEKILGYIKLFLLITYYNLKSRFIYRASFIFSILQSIFVSMLLVGTIWIMLAQFHDINGWNLYEIGFVFGIAKLIHAIITMFFSTLWFMDMLVNHGELDKLLVKPRSPLFLLVFQRIEIHSIGEIIAYLTVVIYCAVNSGAKWGYTDIFNLIIFVISSCIIFFCLIFLTGLCSFWFLKTNSLRDFTNTIYSCIIPYPLPSYGRVMQCLFTFIIPIGFIYYYPFLGLFGKSDAMFSGYIAFLSPLVAVIMILISAASWKIGLRNYKSAGN